MCVSVCVLYVAACAVFFYLLERSMFKVSLHYICKKVPRTLHAFSFTVFTFTPSLLSPALFFFVFFG